MSLSWFFLLLHRFEFFFRLILYCFIFIFHHTRLLKYRHIRNRHSHSNRSIYKILRSVRAIHFLEFDFFGNAGCYICANAPRITAPSNTVVRSWWPLACWRICTITHKRKRNREQKQRTMHGLVENGWINHDGHGQWLWIFMWCMTILLPMKYKFSTEVWRFWILSKIDCMKMLDGFIIFYARFWEFLNLEMCSLISTLVEAQQTESSISNCHKFPILHILLSIPKFELH